MAYIGPAMMTIALGLGTSELYKESSGEPRPSKLSIAALAAGFVFCLCVIIRAQASFFGGAS